ncbi:MAG: glycosyltransferase [Ktedonobacterales bacterium]|nr:glycosyltransferase [Ktedonobacterales bacterium]
MPKASFSEASMGQVRVATTQSHQEWAQQMQGAEAHQRRSSLHLIAFLMLGINVLLFAFIVRNLAIFAPHYTALDRASSVLLLLSEIYVTLHGAGYFLNIIHASRAPNVARQTRLARLNVPSVAIYIATYNEPAEIIEETVIAVTLLDYADKAIYINCDHQSAEQARAVGAIARRHGVHFIHRTPNTGFKAGGINAFINRLGRDLPAAELLCILDADSVPTPTFLREMVPYLQDDPRLAFVQAPQFYGNAAASPVAASAATQQTVFANYISEGKQASDAMFFCGTNVVFRLAALRDIGGLRTDSVTEDYATSMLLHRRRWRSQYCNAAYVTGVGPTDLNAYWTQQSRWSVGNMESCRAALPLILFGRGFTFGQRWEYLLSGSYYLVGVNTVVTICAPTLYLLFNIRPLLMSPIVYVIAYLPNVVLANWFYFASMGQRGFTPRQLFRAQSLTFITFPVFVGSAVAALLGRKRAFAVTPKGASATLPLRAFWPHLTLGLLLIVAMTVGVTRFIHEWNLALIVNVLWCAYHLNLLTTVRHFNRPEVTMDIPSTLTGGEMAHVVANA